MSASSPRYDLNIRIPKDQEQHVGDLSREAEQIIVSILNVNGARDIKVAVKADGKDSYTRSVRGITTLIIPVEISGDVGAIDSLDARIVDSIKKKIEKFPFTRTKKTNYWEVKVTKSAGSSYLQDHTKHSTMKTATSKFETDDEVDTRLETVDGTRTSLDADDGTTTRLETDDHRGTRVTLETGSGSGVGQVSTDDDTGSMGSKESEEVLRSGRSSELGDSGIESDLIVPIPPVL